jgi:hypothetical protein
MQLSINPIQYHEYVRQNTFQFEVANIPPLAVITCLLPNNNNDPVEVPLGNEKAFVAGKANFDGGDITLRDSVDIAVANVVMEWRRQVYDERTGRIGRPSEYKKDGILQQFTPDGTLVRTWTLSGCWIQAINWGTLDYGTAEIQQITCTIQYDKGFLG